jgi:hypothetical protein
MSDLGYSDTPLIPGTNWHVHDGDLVRFRNTWYRPLTGYDQG